MPIDNEEKLDELLTRPTPQVVETLRRLPGDVLVLGVAGKMGVTLARMARRAADEADGTTRGRASLAESVSPSPMTTSTKDSRPPLRRVTGVARFTSGGEAEFHRHGVETLRCDLLDEAGVANLPDAPNVIFLAARKFGSTGDEPLTWAMNAIVPAIVARRYAKSRIVALSTGNVYALVSRDSNGSRESDPPQPIGEYAMSCLAKERVFEYYSRANGTPMAVLRLNYACDLRYGVLVDLAQKIWRGEAVDLAMGYFNTLWQGDACAMALRALDHAASPPWIVNVTGPERLSVRNSAERLGLLMNKPVRFEGKEAETALLSDASIALAKLGPLQITADELLVHVAHWVMLGGRSLNKPTHFEVRDGRF